MNNDEPVYVDDPFEDRDLSVWGQDFHAVELCLRAFKCVGRTRLHFKSDAEAARWRRIDRAVKAGDIPVEWVHDRLKLAAGYHWGLEKVMAAILNRGRMDEWVAKNIRHVGGRTIRQEDLDVIQDS